MTQQLRRHSGDIHMLSHTLWAGACTHACTLSPLPLALPDGVLLTGRCSYPNTVREGSIQCTGVGGLKGCLARLAEMRKAPFIWRHALQA